MLIEIQTKITIAKDGKKRKRKFGLFKCDFCQKEFLLESPNKRRNKEKNYCSKQCSQNVISNCIICNKEFNLNSATKKTCSKECTTQHGKNRAIKRKAARIIDVECKSCGTVFKRDSKRIQGGFCTRKCASKFYVNNGTYDKWISCRTPRKGENIPCIICGSLFYVKPSLIENIDRPKTCSKKCKYEYLSDIFSGEGNPMYGVHPTTEQTEKKYKHCWKNIMLKMLMNFLKEI